MNRITCEAMETEHAHVCLRSEKGFTATMVWIIVGAILAIVMLMIIFGVTGKAKGIGQYALQAR